MSKKIPLAEFKEMEHAIMILEATWKQFLDVKPNDWYEFKYHATMRNFIEQNRYESLREKVTISRLTQKAKLSIQTYQELQELSEISNTLTEVLNNPPLGLKQSPNVLNKKQNKF